MHTPYIARLIRPVFNRTMQCDCSVVAPIHKQYPVCSTPNRRITAFCKRKVDLSESLADPRGSRTICTKYYKYRVDAFILVKSKYGGLVTLAAIEGFRICPPLITGNEKDK